MTQTQGSQKARPFTLLKYLQNQQREICFEYPFQFLSMLVYPNSETNMLHNMMTNTPPNKEDRYPGRAFPVSIEKPDMVTDDNLLS